MHLKVSDLDSPYYDVVDLNNGHRIPAVQEADDVTGEFSCYLQDSINKDLICDKKTHDPILFKFKGNIKLRKKLKKGEKHCG